VYQGQLAHEDVVNIWALLPGEAPSGITLQLTHEDVVERLDETYPGGGY
jgi:hypothetical protein